jgi:cephalosporin-C deacetylase
MSEPSPSEPSPPRHGFPFDPSHGHDLARLLSVEPPPAPEDFDGFWRARHDAARQVRVAPALGPFERRERAVEVYDIAYTSTGGRRIGGWLSVPADGHVTSGCVATHGYGGRRAPEPRLAPPGAATIWPCLYGLPSRSRHRGVPHRSKRHVLHGIVSRETYVHGDCAADVWCAATALLQLVPEAASRLCYLGESFGGGIGPLALPWDERFHAAALSVPSFGNHPLRLTLPCTGSGEAVRTRHARDPGVTEVLRYYDAAIAATRVRIPVHVGAALFDPAVPPPGQFAVYNGLAGPKELFVLTAGHFNHPTRATEAAALTAAQHRFLKFASGGTAAGEIAGGGGPGNG